MLEGTKMRHTAARLIIMGTFVLSAAWADDSENSLATAKSAILKKLRDPDSAKFSDLLIKEKVVCGKVNAKNRFGGYEGPKGFVYIFKLNMAFIDSGDPISTDVLDTIAVGYENYCK